MGKAICVFCSSSDKLPAVYFEDACTLGRLLGRRGDTLIYGGGNLGLMGAMAEAAIKEKGRVTGIIPRFMHSSGVAFDQCGELCLTETMRERKAAMEQRADAFIALPGGFGTLEEVLEILTLKQLHLHAKPVVFVNTNGFYDGLFQFFERIYSEKFAKAKNKELYALASDPESAMKLIDEYRPPLLPKKWFGANGQKKKK